MRRIDADELYKTAIDIIKDKADYKAWAIANAIMMADTVEAEPVKHGQWTEDDYAYNSCSECGYEHNEPEYTTPYCPNCGAKMDGGEN